MPKVLVLYYSSYGHMEQMANAAAEGARQAGAEAVVKRVPELVSEDVARNAQFKLDRDEISGGSPYGATTITGGQGQRMPSQNELDAARFQGRLVAETAAKLTP
jgi:multimeric flavodoxin WrbA